MKYLAPSRSTPPGFDFPDITDEDLDRRNEETREALLDAIEKGEPVPKGYGLLDDEND